MSRRRASIGSAPLHLQAPHHAGEPGAAQRDEDHGPEHLQGQAAQGGRAGEAAEIDAQRNVEEAGEGLEQQEVAEILGLKTSTFNGYAGDKREPSIKYLIKFAEYFGVSIDYLTGYSDIKDPYLSNLSEELVSFINDPKNTIYIELALDIKNKTISKNHSKPMIS